jgi:hypothetical protein
LFFKLLNRNGLFSGTAHLSGFRFFYRLLRVVRTQAFPMRFGTRRGQPVPDVRILNEALLTNMPKLSIRDLDLKGKRVFMRVDFNVPLAPGGQEITSDKRIKAALPTIQYALDHGAGLVLASHLGRPKGKVNPEMSLKPVAVRLSELLGKPVAFAPDCIGAAVEAMLPKPGEILLLENLR